MTCEYIVGDEAWGEFIDGNFVPTGGSYLDDDGERTFWGEPRPESGPSAVVTRVDEETGTVTIEPCPTEP